MHHDYIWFDEASTMTYSAPPPWEGRKDAWKEAREREDRYEEQRQFFKALMHARNYGAFQENIPKDLPMEKVRPTYTQRSLAKMPEMVCIQYIGGPKNAMQEFKNWKKSPEVQDGRVFNIAMENPAAFTQDSAYLEVYSYTSVFIPMEQTPFSDAQVVIAVFQG